MLHVCLACCLLLPIINNMLHSTPLSSTNTLSLNEMVPTIGTDVLAYLPRVLSKFAKTKPDVRFDSLVYWMDVIVITAVVSGAEIGKLHFVRCLHLRTTAICNREVIQMLQRVQQVHLLKLSQW